MVITAAEERLWVAESMKLKEPCHFTDLQHQIRCEGVHLQYQLTLSGIFSADKGTHIGTYLYAYVPTHVDYVAFIQVKGKEVKEEN